MSVCNKRLCVGQTKAPQRIMECANTVKDRHKDSRKKGHDCAQHSVPVCALWCVSCTCPRHGDGMVVMSTFFECLVNIFQLWQSTVSPRDEDGSRSGGSHLPATTVHESIRCLSDPRCFQVACPCGSHHGDDLAGPLAVHCDVIIRMDSPVNCGHTLSFALCKKSFSSRVLQKMPVSHRQPSHGEPCQATGKGYLM